MQIGSQLFIALIKITEKNSLEEEQIILAYSVKGHTPQSADSKQKTTWQMVWCRKPAQFMVAGKQGEGRDKIQTPRACPQ